MLNLCELMLRDRDKTRKLLRGLGVPAREALAAEKINDALLVPGLQVDRVDSSRLQYKPLSI